MPFPKSNSSGLAICLSRAFLLTTMAKVKEATLYALGRRLVTLTAQVCGYKGTEIAEYLQKDPSSATKYAKGKIFNPR